MFCMRTLVISGQQTTYKHTHTYGRYSSSLLCPIKKNKTHIFFVRFVNNTTGPFVLWSSSSGPQEKNSHPIFLTHTLDIFVYNLDEYPINKTQTHNINTRRIINLRNHPKWKIKCHVKDINKEKSAVECYMATYMYQNKEF